MSNYSGLGLAIAIGELFEALIIVFSVIEVCLVILVAEKLYRRWRPNIKSILNSTSSHMEDKS